MSFFSQVPFSLSCVLKQALRGAQLPQCCPHTARRGPGAAEGQAGGSSRPTDHLLPAQQAPVLWVYTARPPAWLDLSDTLNHIFKILQKALENKCVSVYFRASSWTLPQWMALLASAQLTEVEGDLHFLKTSPFLFFLWFFVKVMWNYLGRTGGVAFCWQKLRHERFIHRFFARAFIFQLSKFPVSLYGLPGWAEPSVKGLLKKWKHKIFNISGFLTSVCQIFY